MQSAFSMPENSVSQKNKKISFFISDLGTPSGIYKWGPK
jgi:hypothetical protein